MQMHVKHVLAGRVTVVDAQVDAVAAHTARAQGDGQLVAGRKHARAVIERQLGQDWSVGAGYVLVLGRQLLVSDNVNLAPPVVLTAENSVAPASA